MAENVHMYQEKKNDENVNMRQEAKPITPKAILKRPNLKTIEEDPEEADVNLRRGSNPYQYNVIDNFRWTSTNIFFRDLMKIGSYRGFMQIIPGSNRKKGTKECESDPSRGKTSLQIICKTGKKLYSSIMGYGYANISLH